MAWSMKVISLNMEGKKHYDTVSDFLATEKADVVCLQEAPEEFRANLKDQGYQSTFELMFLRPQTDDEPYREGLIMATKQPFFSWNVYYNKPNSMLQTFDSNDKHNTSWQSVLYNEVMFEDSIYLIGTTHFTWTPKGETPNEDQLEDIKTLLDIAKEQPPHMLCGDFNIPRHINHLYDDLIKMYEDEIPVTYQSSLDKNLHRKGDDPSKEKMFTDFMVDYFFTTKPPYDMADVRMEFGVSDHAAIVGTLLKTGE